MAISPLSGQDQIRAAQAVSAFRAASVGTTPGVTTRQPDSVSLSEAARSLASARSAVADASDVRTDRVAQIKAAIASGTYAVDSRQLARAMVKHLSNQ